MKLKKISLMTIAAIYAAGAGAAAPTSDPSHGMRSVVITDAIIKYNEELKSGKLRNGANSVINRTSNGKNVHRAIATDKNSKVPFKYQKGLKGEQTYIVELSDKPVSLYRGGIQQFNATSPSMSQVPVMLNARGHNKLDVNSRDVKSYKAYLSNKQEQILSQMSATVGGNLDVKERYTLAFNGMSLRMTQDQASRVAALPGVRNVSIEQMYELHSDTGPKHIAADGLWTGSAADDKYKGEGIVVGVLDTGINSDHPSFAAVAGDGYTHKMPARYDSYLGDCEKAEFASMCNDKLIGVRSYESITDSYMSAAFQPELPYWNITDPKRPANGEDYNGHGSHTASTAAGNELMDVDYVVPVPGETGDGIATDLKLAKISGVAPRANIIMYQVCFPGDGSFGDGYGGCPGSALLSAIEDAVADGVDVINYSIGSTYGAYPWDDPMELGFLAAREAGISVAASAGNAYDPQYASLARGAIDHFSPWLTSVAATTHGREFAVEGKMLTATSGGEQPLMDLVGSGITGEYTGPVVQAVAYGSEHEMCNEPFAANFFDMMPDGVTPFDTAPIVVCKRGEIARVTKAANVEAGGAGGFILWNTGYSETTNNDPYVIPGIHINYGSYYGSNDNDYYGLQDWLAEGSDHRLTITASEVLTKQGTADYVANFSSRGPNLGAPDVMSPNLAAPGVDIYAAWADEMPFSMNGMPADYAAISGTSMASPHVAGSMALLTQAHPDWTPAQIQSALMTTASLEGVTRSRDGYPYDAVAAGSADAGSGVINVSRANNAGLLLDESTENYRAANPQNGGNIHTLNLPYFFHTSCTGSCTLMRVVTATKDGTYSVEATPDMMDGAQMLELEVTPKTFTLKAGQSQAINLTAKILDIEAIGADSSGLLLGGNVVMTPQDSTTPTQHMPVSVRFEGDGMPSEVSGIIHREQGHTLTPMLNTAEIQSLNSKVFGLTKGERLEFQLKSAEYEKRLYSEGLTVEEIEAAGGAKVTFFDVPEGTKRVVWEVLSAPKHAWTSIDIGMDVNEDEEIQWLDEAICYSYTDNGDFCAINDPLPGRYWAIAANWKFTDEDPKNLADEIVVSLAIVGDEDSGTLTVEGPASTDGITPYQIKLNHNIPGALEGDIYYGVVGLGSDEYNDTNLGDFAVKLQHFGTDTTIEGSQTAAKVGDIVDFTVELAPNLLGAEREFTVNTVLSEGMKLVEDSITIGGLGNYEDGMTIDGNSIVINAVQASSKDMKRHYEFTTNLTDETCKVPYGDDPTFFDLSQNFADIGLSGLSNDTIYFPLEENGLPHVPLYGNPEHYAQNTLGISPFGYVQFDEMREFYNFNRKFDDMFQTFPDTIVAPLWRGDVKMPEAGWDDDWNRVNTVFVIYTPEHYVVQWNGGEEWSNRFIGNPNPDPDAKFNIQTVISTGISFEKGSHEMIFAYKTLQSENAHYGSIGLHGYWGERAERGPQNGWLNDSFAYNDVDEKVSEGMVVCGDYRGPEQTAMTLNFSAVVSASAIGTGSMVTIESQYVDSEMVTVTHSLATPSNISVAPMSDMTMEENTTLENLSVNYNDVKGTTNGIMVSGENITAVVTGNTFAITPDTDWNGMTEVTVMVHDMAYPSDQTSTSFMLTVNSDGVEPTPPATETPDEEVEDDSNDSGGSLGFLAIGLMGLLARRRRKLH